MRGLRRIRLTVTAQSTDVYDATIRIVSRPEVKQ